MLETDRRRSTWPPRVDRALLGRLAAGAAGPDPDESIPVEAPFTGEIIGAVPATRAGDVPGVVAAARTAQRAWARRSPGGRAAVMLRFHDLLLERTPELLDVVQLETGKARRDAFEEVTDVAIQARYYAHTAAAHLRPRRRQGALPLLTRSWELHHPRGVVAIIAPWNYPLVLGVGDTVPALLAGNAVVLKPDTQTPFTALWTAVLLAEAGLPPGVLQVVTGRGRALGDALIRETDYLSFTGSTATGRVLAAQAGSLLKDCSMELGGKNPLLVLPDARLGTAVRGAVRAITGNGGQLCVGVERVYAHDDVYDEFVHRLAAALRAVRLGAAFDYGPDMGSLVSADQLAVVRRHVDDATARGAEVLAGGKARPDLGPYFFEPTLLAGVTEEMELCREETFGPVAAVYRCASVDEMVARANDSEYGLAASVWSGDGRAALRVAARLHAGTISINDAYAAAWGSVDSTMGGYGISGLGRRHGAPGIRKYTETQALARQLIVPIDTPPFLGHGQFAWLLGRALRVLRHTPGVR